MRWEWLKEGRCPRCGERGWESLGWRVRCLACAFTMSARRMLALLGREGRRAKRKAVAEVRDLGVCRRLGG